MEENLINRGDILKFHYTISAQYYELVCWYFYSDVLARGTGQM